MANLGQKNDTYLIRFRYQGKEYKRSLRTRDKSAAEAAKNTVELTIHRLLTGLLQMPEGVEAADFIVSGGTRLSAVNQGPPRVLPSTNDLIRDYLDSQKNLLAESYHYSQSMHLRHLVRHLGDDIATAPCNRVTFQELDGYLNTRLAIRHPLTAERERITLLQFYKWAVRQEYFESSPAAKLRPIKGGKDRPPFRTIAEINRIIERGGLTEADALELWECLYLTPEDIGRLLAAVRANACEDYAVMLHAIPAYTGMRRGEMLRLRWLDVDLDEDFLYARSRKQSRTKSETVRRIDIHPELKQILASWRDARPKGQFVVCEAKTLEPIRKDRATRAFWLPMRDTDWCLDRKKGWYKLGFHTYRHSFASNLAARGVDQRIIDEWMGHQTEAMRKRYRHLFPKDRRSAIESFSLAAPAQHCRPLSLRKPAQAEGQSPARA